MNRAGLAQAAGGAVPGPLRVALAASVALHAALLAGVPDLWTYSERPATAPLNAWLVPGARTATTLEPPAAAPPPSDAALQPERRAPRRAPAAVAPAPAAPAPAERAEAPPSSSADPAPAGARRDAEPALALGAPTLAPRAGDDAIEAGSLAQYRLALMGAAKRLKRYPPQAIDRGLEGRVEVRLVIGAGGEPAAVSVKRSSGHDVLDRQAVETLARAAAATPVPPALRNREVVVEIPVVYELKTAG